MSRLHVAVAVLLLTGLALAAFDMPNIEREYDQKARPVRLLAMCQGIYYAANEEDEFPRNCDWVEPIRDGTK